MGSYISRMHGLNVLTEIDHPSRNYLILTSGNYSTLSPVLLLFDYWVDWTVSSFTYYFRMGYFGIGRCHAGQCTYSDSQADRCECAFAQRLVVIAAMGDIFEMVLLDHCHAGQTTIATVIEIVATLNFD